MQGARCPRLPRGLVPRLPLAPLRGWPRSRPLAKPSGEDGWDYEAQPWVIGHRTFVRRLTGEGYRVAWSTASSPEQITGHLPSGASFYFRERWGGASLWVGAADADPLTAPAWHRTADLPEMSRGAIEGAFRRLVAAYESQRNG